MKVQQIIKKHRLPKKESIKIQILMWCALRHIQVTQSILDMLTVLAMNGRTELASLCTVLSTDKGVFKSSQSARNMVIKAITLGLIVRLGKKHEIELNPAMGIGIEENTLINYQFLTIDSN